MKRGLGIFAGGVLAGFVLAFIVFTTISQLGLTQLPLPEKSREYATPTIAGISAGALALQIMSVVIVGLVAASMAFYLSKRFLSSSAPNL
jgi:hypothetical protein